jgi:transposase InsO family protein
LAVSKPRRISASPALTVVYQLQALALNSGQQSAVLDSLDEVRAITAKWLEPYKKVRPHDRLGSLPPARYREQLLAAEIPV